MSLKIESLQLASLHYKSLVLISLLLVSFFICTAKSQHTPSQPMSASAPTPRVSSLLALITWKTKSMEFAFCGAFTPSASALVWMIAWKSLFSPQLALLMPALLLMKFWSTSRVFIWITSFIQRKDNSSSNEHLINRMDHLKPLRYQVLWQENPTAFQWNHEKRMIWGCTVLAAISHCYYHGDAGTVGPHPNPSQTYSTE